MPVIDYEQLRQAMKPDLISQEACNFANQLSLSITLSTMPI